MESAEDKGIIGKNGKRWFPNPNGKLCTDVWEIVSDRHLNKKNGKTVKQDHPTIKPEMIIDRIIKTSSNIDDLVLDIFSGSGTTSYIAKKNKRNFIAIENNKKYVKIIEERLRKIC